MMRKSKEVPRTFRFQGDIIQENNEEKNSVHFGCGFFRIIGKILKITFSPFLSRQVLFLILLLLAGGLGEFLAYQTGVLSSQFYSVLTTRDESKYSLLSLYAILIIISTAFSLSVVTYIAGLLAVEMREILTKTIHSKYFHSSAYFVIINYLNIDNPDQRFVQEVDLMCTTFAKIAPDLVLTPIVIPFYTYKTVDKAGWLGPISIFLFFIVFTVVNRLLVPWVAKAVFERERQEGYFRFHHAQLRTQAEQAAFSKADFPEYCTAECALNRVLATQQSLVTKSSILNFATNSADYFGALLVYFALGAAIFGDIYPTNDASELATIISETSFYFFYLINKFTKLLDMANDAAKIAGFAHRLTNVLDHLDNMYPNECPATYMSWSDSRISPADVSNNDAHNWASTSSTSTVISNIEKEILNTESKKPYLEIKGLHVTTPTWPFKLVVSDLNLSISKSESVLITGPSGVGKTSLLRVIAGLWPTSTDSIYLNNSRSINHHLSSGEICYLPQRPYLAPSLPGFTSLLPTSLQDSILDDACTRALRFVHLLLFAVSPPGKLRNLPDSKNSRRGRANRNSHPESSSDMDISTVWSTNEVLKALEYLHEFRLININTKIFLQNLLESNDAKVDFVPNASFADGSSVVDEFYNKRPFTHLKDWRSSISPGEQQRLALARVCYQHPRLVILDEATSQLGEGDEQKAYESLASRHITLISVGHRVSLRSFHQMELKLIGESGSWSLSPI